MFVKVYRYTVKNRRIKAIQKIEKEANKIYQRRGLKKSLTLTRRKGIVTHIMLLEFYDSKKQFKKVKSRVNKDPKIWILWKKFLKVVNKPITEDEYETSKLSKV